MQIQVQCRAEPLRCRLGLFYPERERLALFAVPSLNHSKKHPKYRFALKGGNRLIRMRRVALGRGICLIRMRRVALEREGSTLYVYNYLFRTTHCFGLLCFGVSDYPPYVFRTTHPMSIFPDVSDYPPYVYVFRTTHPMSIIPDESRYEKAHIDRAIS